MPDPLSRSARPAASGASGPITASVMRSARAQIKQCRVIGLGDRVAREGTCDAVIAGRDTEVPDIRVSAQAPGDRMFATAAAHDQDAMTFAHASHSIGTLREGQQPRPARQRRDPPAPPPGVPCGAVEKDSGADRGLIPW